MEEIFRQLEGIILNELYLKLLEILQNDIGLQLNLNLIPV